MEQAVIVSGARTPIGAFQGSLSTLSAPELGSIAIKEALRRAGLSNELIEDVLMGCVLTSGMGQAPARQAALGAGLATATPCTTINKVCGSGMKAIMMAAQAIKSEDAKIVVAGGMESMSNVPYALEKARTGYRMGNGTLLDLMVHDGLWDPYNDCHMGSCGDATASEFQITREQLDEFSAGSVQKALDAKTTLREEIAPVQIAQKKGDALLVEDDEQPGKAIPPKLPFLSPVFSKDGSTTAGNASSINDGAAALVVMSKSEAQRRSLKPLGRIIGYVQHAHEPEWFTTAPAYAIQALLQKHHLTENDIDLFEVNEAFAVVAMVVADKVGINPTKLNVNGGAVALGHPIGMSGARLVLTALYELQRRGGRYAICSPCIGGGEATAILIEAVH